MGNNQIRYRENDIYLREYLLKLGDEITPQKGVVDISVRKIDEVLLHGAISANTSADRLKKAMHSCRELSDLEFPLKESAALEGMARMPIGEDATMSAWERILLQGYERKRLYEDSFEVTYREDDAIVMVRRR